MQTNQNPPRIPLFIKITYTAFVCVLVPVYLHEYGPTNFLYFCDVALLMGLAAIWLESPLLASAPLVGILVPQLFWMVDFIGSALGLHVVGMTDYMFDSKYTLFARGLSFFHFWLPIFLAYLVYRLGYDRRAFQAWTVLAWGLLLVCFYFMPPPPTPADNPNLPVNINYVFGVNEAKPQEWMPPLAWFSLLMVGLPTLAFWPSHLLLQKCMPSSPNSPRHAIFP